MTVLDPGHRFLLHTLDGAISSIIQFVKRVGAKFPGNDTAYAGTTLQEVWRACHNRLQYLNDQEQDFRTEKCMWYMRESIRLLEERAADRHGRVLGKNLDFVTEPICAKCGHVGCTGKCHAHLEGTA